MVTTSDHHTPLKSEEPNNSRPRAFVTFFNNCTEINIIYDTSFVNTLNVQVHPCLQNGVNLSYRLARCAVQALHIVAKSRDRREGAVPQ